MVDSDVGAVILAGGLGTRMLPLTEHTPKHLLPLGRDPLIAHHLRRLAQAGIRDVVLATAHHADRFRPVLGDGRAWGLRLEYAVEPTPLGTAGGLAHAAASLPDSVEWVVVLNGDLLSGHDLDRHLAAARALGASVTLHVRQVADARAYGSVVADRAGRVTAFVEKSETPPTTEVNGGTYVVRRRVLDAVATGAALSLEREVLPRLIGSVAGVAAHREQAYWRDVGTPEALVAANQDLVRGIVPGLTVARPTRDAGALLDPLAQVAPSATVSGGAVIGAEVVLGPDSRVVGSVLMPGARVGRGAVVVDSAIGPGASIGDGCHVVGAAVGDGGLVRPSTVLEEGARVAGGGEGRHRG